MARALYLTQGRRHVAGCRKGAEASYIVVMVLRMPQNLRSQLRYDTGADVLSAELMAEQANSLGRMGRSMEKALAALEQARANGVDAAAIETLTRGAADAVWSFFVQREVLGMTNHKPVIAHYAIPKDVLNRLGGR